MADGYSMKFHDTIAAIATARGEAGIGIVRVSGDLALPIAADCSDHRAACPSQNCQRIHLHTDTS